MCEVSPSVKVSFSCVLLESCLVNIDLTFVPRMYLNNYEHLGSLPYLCTKNETMVPLHVATLELRADLCIMLFP